MMGQKECKKYIECDVAKEAVYKIIVPEWVHVAFKTCIDDVPSADVRPVVHGAWKPNPRNPYWLDCTVCGYGKPERNVYNFCPNCGADMREEP